MRSSILHPQHPPMPGSTPVRGAIVPPPNPTSTMSNDEFLQWSSSGINNFANNPAAAAAAFNGSSFSPAPLQPAQQQMRISQPSNQLTRRPVNRQLVPQRQAYELDNTWAPLPEEPAFDQGATDLLDEEENIDLLEERAAVAKREALAKRKQIPPFVQKLSSFLDESKNTDLIRWSDKGDSFIVLDEDEFAKTLIPELFKHNNYASFVRQLNMYGFHKRVGLSDNSMKASERKNKSPSEYSNPYFRRGHPNLLWLINKPKGGAQKKKGGRAKTEDGADGDSDEEIKEPEELPGLPGAIPKAITAAGEPGGPLQKRELGMVRQQLQDIQRQQQNISAAINRLRKDHNQLYQQAVAFQTLHDRHENSINAILSFLATIYNRSLDGTQGGPNFTQMFANAIPQEQRGDVVDMGDVTSNQQPGGMSPMRRQQRLLMAPPAVGARSTSASPSAPASPLPRSDSFQGRRQQSQSGHIEELDGRASESPKVKPEHGSPQQDMLNLINNTNAHHSFGSYNGNPVDLPSVLQQFETSNGKPPLTPEQRNNMLSLIASTSSPPGTNNALVSPTPPPMPDLGALNHTQNELELLARMQREQSAKLDEVSQLIQPLSPSGAIPGMGDQYFSGDLDNGVPPHLDLDQYLNMNAYNGTGTLDDPTFDFPTPQDSSMFDFTHMGRLPDQNLAAGGYADTATSSTGGTPDIDRNGGDDGSALRSPMKRRRKD